MLSRRSFLEGVGGVALVSALAACTTSRSSGLPAATGLPVTPVPTKSLTATAGPTSLDTGTPEPGATAPASDDATLRRKIGRLLIVGFRGLELADGSGIARALDGGLGGVILFDRDQATGKPRNIASPTQLRALTDSLRRRATVPLLVAIDQEGGRVARLTPAHGFPTTSSEAAIGATDDPDVARSAGAAMGQTMAAAGIDLDLAPVVDVNVNPTNPAIGALDRSFSADPSVVAAMADAEIEGLHEHRVRACLKHFPGLGSASANTDFDRVDVTETWRRRELEPYQTLFGLGTPDAVMVAHIIDRQLDSRYPASLSPKIVDGVLRSQLGWEGPVMTDSMGAVAITSTYGRAEAAGLALEAGVDLLLYANQGEYVDDIAPRVTDDLLAMIHAGRLTEARLDLSIARLERLVAGTPLAS